MVIVRRNGNGVWCIIKVATLSRARLVLEWVTVGGQTTSVPMAISVVL